MLTNKKFVIDIWSTPTRYIDLINKINERFYFNIKKFSGIDYSENELLIIIDIISKPILEKISNKIYDTLNDVESVQNIKLNGKFRADTTNIVDYIIKYVLKENKIPSIDLIENNLASTLMQIEIKSLYKRLKFNQPLKDNEIVDLIFFTLRNAGIE